MRFVRALCGVLLWVVASLLGLVGAVLCVTIILLPVGIPLLSLSGRLFGTATKLMLPRAVSHPVDELGKKAGKMPGKKAGKKARRKLGRRLP